MSEDGVVLASLGFKRNIMSPEYIGYQLVVVSISSAAFSGLFLGLRLYTRKYIVRSLGWDDWWIVCAWLAGVALTIADCIVTKYGAGSHVRDLPNSSPSEMFLKMILVLGSTYIAALALAKISICCFYLRLSPDHTFRLVVYLMIAFTASYSFAGFLIIMFSCNPVAASWDLTLVNMPSYSCINRAATYLAQAGLNILTDVCIVVLPLPTIWRLQLPYRQKVTVSSVFAIGILVCIISTVRLGYVIKVYNSTDITWDSNPVFIWTTIETHITIFCACVATLKPLVNRFFPRFLGRTPTSSAIYTDNDNARNAPTPALDIAKRTARLAKTGSGHHHHHHPFRFSAYSDSNASEGRTFSLRGYRERVMGRSQHKAVVTSGAMARHRDAEEGDCDSQRGIVDGMEHDMADFKLGGVFVTRTVHVS